MTLNVQNVHRWLTHMSAVAGGSLSQSCQWLSPVTQTKLTKVHFKTRELKLETLKTISTFRKINAILLNIKLNRPKLVSMCGYTGNNLAKFHRNILSLSKNIAKSFKGATVF